LQIINGFYHLRTAWIIDTAARPVKDEAYFIDTGQCDPTPMALQFLIGSMRGGAIMYIRTIILSILSALIFSGCASYKATTPPPLGYDLTAQTTKVEQDGVVLMAKPIHQETEVERYFDEDPLKYGVLPVQVHLTNKSHEDTLVCASSGLNLLDAENNRVPSMSVDQVMDKVKKSHWRTAGWTVGFGIFGLIPSAMNVNKVNKEMRADYESRIFKGGKLAEGNTTEGFMFYDVPEDIGTLNGWHLTAVLKNAEGDSDLMLTQELAGTVVKRKRKDESE
jgi:hypothetical protein